MPETFRCPNCDGEFFLDDVDWEAPVHLDGDSLRMVGWMECFACDRTFDVHMDLKCLDMVMSDEANIINMIDDMRINNACTLKTQAYSEEERNGEQ